MSLEGDEIVGVRELSEDEVLGSFTRNRDSVLGLELDSRNIIFPTGDTEANVVGNWFKTREELESLVSMYILYWNRPQENNDQHSLPVEKEPTHLVLGDTKPTIQDNGEIEVPQQGRIEEIVPGGKGIGPAAWHIREEISEDAHRDTEDVPTPEEIMDLYENGEIESQDVMERLTEAERVHNRVTFSAIP